MEVMSSNPALDQIVDLGESCAKSVLWDAAVFDDAALLEVLLAAERARQQLELTTAHLLAEAETRKLAERDSGRRTGAWLGDRSRQAKRSCTARVGVAVKLRQFPRFDLALAQGAVSWHHAEALCRVANPRNAVALEAMSERLINLAALCSFERWAKELAGIAQQLDADGGHRSLHNASRLYWDRLPGDVGELAGRFSDTDAALIESVLGKRADDIFRRHRDNPADDSTPSRGELWAQALIEVLRGEPADDLAAGPTIPVRPPRADLTIVHHHGAAGYTDSNGNPLDETSELRAALCDCFVTHVHVDGHGVPMHVGRTRRLATAAMRRALVVRDGGCVFPGCHRPVEWCDAHHVQPWDQGGETSLDNLVLLCRHHHGVTHRDGWNFQPDPEAPADDPGWFRWVSPTGRVLTSQRHEFQRGQAPPGPCREPVVQVERRKASR